jgi:WXXGXW repeat (2 copies)
VLEWSDMRRGLAALSLSMAACSRTLPHPAYTTQPSSALIEVTSPPPPGRIERIPAAPWASAVWVDGEWAWRRNRWAWRPGAWVEPPPGAHFAPWAFVRGPDGRLWIAPGTWRDAKGAALDLPVPLMSADVEPTQVVNASGAVELVGRTLRPGASATPSPPH